MTVVGVIAEWNPFHNGHRYLIEQIRAKIPDATIVAVMSGNFVQRGEPAITSKWSRAKTALANGVDLIFELPIWYATQPADLFAKGAVDALHTLGVTYLVFGVEDNNFNDFQKLAEWEATHSEALEYYIKQVLTQYPNKSFAERRLLALELAIQEVPELKGLSVYFENNSNSLLAYTYVRENARWDRPFALLPILRKGMNHRTDMANVLSHANLSGSQIRTLLKDKNHKNYPILQNEASAYLMAETYLGDWAQLFPYLKYRLISMSLAELEQIYQISEGIAFVFKREINQTDDMTAFIRKCRNRNWPVTRLRRAALMVVLNVSKQQVLEYQQMTSQPLLLLGMSKIGKNHLRLLKKQTTKWIIISRVNQQCEEEWPLWINSDRLFRQMVYDDNLDENFRQLPIME